MALTTTTLASAVAITDTSVVLTSATGITAGCSLIIDSENLRVGSSWVSGTTIPVSRGRDGTATATHKASANVTIELPADLAGPTPTMIPQWPYPRTRRVLSYSAAGAITMPNPGEDMTAVINGTGALAMTLASPTKDMDNCILIVVANGKAAHTVTLTAGFGANTTNSDVMTMHATQTTAFSCIACNGVWVLIGFVAGAATVAGSGLA